MLTVISPNLALVSPRCKSRGFIYFIRKSKYTALFCFIVCMFLLYCANAYGTEYVTKLEAQISQLKTAKTEAETSKSGDTYAAEKYHTAETKDKESVTTIKESESQRKEGFEVARKIYEGSKTEANLLTYDFDVALYKETQSTVKKYEAEVEANQGTRRYYEGQEYSEKARIDIITGEIDEKEALIAAAKSTEGVSAKVEVGNFTSEAQTDLSEMKESLETVGWCIIGTILACAVAFFAYHIIRPTK